MIKLINVSKTYINKKNNKVKALEEINLSIENKGMVFILGKSGSGKSTLLNMLGGLDKFDEGDISILGNSMKQFKPDDYNNYRNTYIGFIFQDYNLIEDYSVEKNLALPLEMQGIKLDKELIENSLNSVGIKEYLKTLPSELSGGQKQRVAIARALIKNPSIILADEPTGNLDSNTGEQIFKLLKEISTEKLVIVVSHDKESAIRYGDRIIEIKDGRIIKDSSPLQKECINRKVEVNKSKLSFAKIFGLSLNSIKKKWIRMIITTILFAFTLSLLGTFFSALQFDINQVALDEYRDKNVKIATLCPELLPSSYLDNNIDPLISVEQALKIENDLSDFQFKRIINRGYENSYSIAYNLNIEETDSNPYYTNIFCSGYIDFEDEEELSSYNAKIAYGRLPNKYNEVTIPILLYDYFVRYGYYDRDNDTETEIKSYDDIINKTITFNNDQFKIVGIIDTGLSDFYDDIKQLNMENVTQEERNKMLSYDHPIMNDLNYNIHSALFVHKSFYDSAVHIYTVYEYDKVEFSFMTDEYYRIGLTKKVAGLKIDYAHDMKYDIVYKNNVERKNLQDNEIILSKDDLLDVIITQNENYTDKDMITDTEIRNHLDNGINVKLNISKDRIEAFDAGQQINYSVVGYYNSKGKNFIFFNEKTIVEMLNDTYIYKSIITPFTGDKETDMKIINYSYREDVDNDYRFIMRNLVSADLDTAMINSQQFRKAFLIGGLVFAIFSALMMMNFIWASITAKFKDIGIIRALGGRQRDIFSIFFYEILITSIISFLLSIGLTVVICYGLDSLLRFGLIAIYNISMFNINIITFVVVLALSIGIAVMGVALPIIRLAKKKPIEIIKA